MEARTCVTRHLSPERGGPLGGCELSGPAVGAGAQGVGIHEGLHSHLSGSSSGWVRRASRVETNSYQATTGNLLGRLVRLEDSRATSLGGMGNGTVSQLPPRGPW